MTMVRIDSGTFAPATGTSLKLFIRLTSAGIDRAWGSSSPAKSSITGACRNSCGSSAIFIRS